MYVFVSPKETALYLRSDEKGTTIVGVKTDFSILKSLIKIEDYILYAKNNGLIFELLEINEYLEKTFTEEDARRRRYEFFYELLKKYNLEISLCDNIEKLKNKLKEIINNLLTNSIKYTDEGEISLKITCVNDLNKNICNLIISCQDTGKGIKKENISRLFTKFDRLDVERNTTTEGTGLGLAITKGLTDMMGGKINVQSQYGKGSIFMVTIPQTIAEVEMPLTNTQAIDLRRINDALIEKHKGMHILIVDDNKLNIKVARKAIADFGFIIDEALDGYECLEKIQNGEKYDLILMDIMMPNMSGETCLKKLKENPSFNTPVIALTADAVAGAKERYLSEGFKDYLQKPFSREQMKEKLNNIFRN